MVKATKIRDAEVTEKVFSEFVQLLDNAPTATPRIQIHARPLSRSPRLAEVPAKFCYSLTLGTWPLNKTITAFTNTVKQSCMPSSQPIRKRKGNIPGGHQRTLAGCANVGY